MVGSRERHEANKARLGAEQLSPADLSEKIVQDQNQATGSRGSPKASFSIVEHCKLTGLSKARS